MTDYLYHITLDTGDIATSPRSAVSAGALADLGPHIDRALDRGRDIIPTTACTLMAATAGGALIGTILGIGERPILTFGVATHSRNSGKLWEILQQGRTFASDPGAPPPVPWLAVRMEPAASPSTLAPWMADYERCMAWAWIERKR